MLGASPGLPLKAAGPPAVSAAVPAAPPILASLFAPRGPLVIPPRRVLAAAAAADAGNGFLRLPPADVLLLTDHVPAAPTRLVVVTAASRGELEQKLRRPAAGGPGAPGAYAADGCDRLYGFVADRARGCRAALCHALAATLRARVPAEVARETPHWARGLTGVLFRVAGPPPDGQVCEHVAYISPYTYERLRVAAARA